MNLIRQFLGSSEPIAQFSKGAIGTASGVIAATSPHLQDVEAWARTIGAVAAAFCSVVMAMGIIAGGVRWMLGRRRAR